MNKVTKLQLIWLCIVLCIYELISLKTGNVFPILIGYLFVIFCVPTIIVGEMIGEFI